MLNVSVMHIDKKDKQTKSPEWALPTYTDGFPHLYQIE